ncbi:ATP-binding protein [Lactiplantibacillus carotarum]|uniref:ATP-binding protein n=1 Tax=Lactiplantibacillus carotarum TaxID=2993456 RepID=UPI00298EE35B|nr:AAA family ATPase [Lactiplantibacillus carotarum]
MWIKHVEIAGFGKFKQRSFDLDTGLQIVYGLNESGKSTLRAFILGMLFGFPSRRHPETRYEPRDSSQYGGSLELVVDGVSYRLTRLGDQPASLQNLATNTPQPISRLAHWLAPYDETQYKQLFTFNQAELTALRSLSATDLNDQLQQVGLVGSAPWRDTATQLRSDADERYKPRGRKPTLNQALVRYHDLTAQVQAARANYPEYQRLQVTIQSLQAQQTTRERELNQLSQAQQRLANLRNQWPVYQQLQQLRTQAQTTITPLTPATVQRTNTLFTKRAELQHTLASARQQLSQQPVDEHSQGLIGFYVRHQTEFETLEGQLPTLQQAFGQYQALTAEVDQTQTTYQQQISAHPELAACLSPTKKAPLAALKTTLTNWQEPSRSQHQQPAHQQLDWRLIAGGVGVVAGLLLPLGAFKWVLALAGFGLLGWFGWDTLQTPTTPVTATEQPDLASQLAAAGLDATLSVQAARLQVALIEELQRAQAAVTSAQQHTATQASRVWQSLQDYEFAAGWIPVDQQQLATSVKRVQQFYEQIHQTMQSQQMAGPDFAYAQRQVQQLTTQLHDVDNQLQRLADENDVADAAGLRTAIEAVSAQSASATSADQLAQQLSPQEQTALAAYQSIGDLQAAISEVRQRVTTAQSDLTTQTAALVTAQTQLKRLSEDGRYATLRQEQANLQTEITVLARQWMTRQLGARWIDQALQTLTNQQLPRVLTRASANFARLTNKRYNKINLNGDQLMAVTADDRQFGVAELSTATKEQLYLAIRLALLAHLGAQAQLPLMIDDGLVNFDDERRRAAWTLLAEVGRDHQLIYFTNETAALTQLPGATVLELS